MNCKSKYKTKGVVVHLVGVECDAKIEINIEIGVTNHFWSRSRHGLDRYSS